MSNTPADIEFAQRGQGPAILFVPGSFGTGAGWKTVMEKLGPGYRFVTTSLLGYGATPERRPPGNASMQQQTEILDSLFERIDAPVHVVAHSFGGLAAIAHAIQGRLKPVSLTLIEANPIGLLRTAGDLTHYAMFGNMTQIYFKDFEAGVADAARHVIDFYGGAGTFDAFPQKVRDYVVATTPSNILDWSSGMAFEPPLSVYNAIAAKTSVVRGGNGHPAMLRLAELLARTLPNARLETVSGGSHFLPATHPSDLADHIKANVTAATA